MLDLIHGRVFHTIMRRETCTSLLPDAAGVLSGLGMVAVSLGLLSWAGFLGCTAACPQGGLKGLAISAATCLVAWWAMVVCVGAEAPRAEL